MKTITSYQGVDLILVPFEPESGSIDKAQLDQYDDITAIVIQQPNFFGSIEDVDEITNWAQEKGILVIGLVNPLAMTLIKPPGDWGNSGADIACGEGQPLGIPLSSGGPYYGFMTCKKNFIRQLPGRIVGKTIDNRGNEGFTLTLQAREQHIRRSKATSNICTNQGLMVTASTIYMSLMGPEGLTETAKACHSKLNEFVNKVTQLEGVDLAFKSLNFHEVVLKLSVPVEEVIVKLENSGVSPGIALGEFYPELKNALLVCVTEVKTSDDIDDFIQMIGSAIKDAS